ncbi:MAG: thioredoxin [Gammaproteobacteria bacterium]|nr:thioredoxin [Gammaproteobacteria bacterium]
MSDSPYIIDITAENYEQVVILGSRQVPVLVDFWASWCQPCQMLMPLLARLADEYQGAFVLAKVNTEEQQEIAAQFGIRSIPTVKLFRDGAPVDEFMGALPEAQIRAFLDKHLPRESDGSVEQAHQLLLQGDAVGAVRVLTDALASDPANGRLTLALAQAQASAGDIDAAEATLDQLPEGEQDKPDVRGLRGQLFFDRITLDAPPPDALARTLAASADDSAARYQMAAHQVMQNDIVGAIENLLQIMQKDRKFGDDAARKALLKLFDMFADQPGITRYRARMFNLLH